MYPIVLAAHNIIRWVVVIIGLLAVVRALLGWFGRRDWTETDRKISSYFGIAFDIQLLVGLLLYIFFSPITKAAFQNFGAAMSITDLRFFAVEHVLFMILALVLVHLGAVQIRKAKTDRAKHQRSAIFFALALVLILAGMPWGRPILPGL